MIAFNLKNSLHVVKTKNKQKDERLQFIIIVNKTLTLYLVPYLTGYMDFMTITYKELIEFIGNN